MKCPYNDCGWCYFPDPDNIKLNIRKDSACKDPEECLYFKELKEQEKANEKVQVR